jgi:multisubunit Na+/H+ antiporter MnhG subunit
MKTFYIKGLNFTFRTLFSGVCFRTSTKIWKLYSNPQDFFQKLHNNKSKAIIYTHMTLLHVSAFTDHLPGSWLTKEILIKAIYVTDVQL